MTNRHSAGSRDKNEPLITEVLRRMNVEYFLMPEGAGFDILLFLAPMVCIEVKNPEQPPSARVLTPTEKARKEWCDELRIPYYVIETPEKMALIVGMWIEDSEDRDKEDEI